MIIGIPKEIKDNEYRVSLPPGGVRELTRRGHSLLVETNAGGGSGFSDDEYVKAGASILQSANEVWQRANMIVKVKEPLPSEYRFLRDDLILFTYLHLAANEGAECRAWAGRASGGRRDVQDAAGDNGSGRLRDSAKC